MGQEPKTNKRDSILLGHLAVPVKGRIMIKGKILPGLLEGRDKVRGHSVGIRPDRGTAKVLDLVFMKAILWDRSVARGLDLITQAATIPLDLQEAPVTAAVIPNLVSRRS